MFYIASSVLSSKLLLCSVIIVNIIVSFFLPCYNAIQFLFVFIFHSIRLSSTYNLLPLDCLFATLLTSHLVLSHFFFFRSPICSPAVCHNIKWICKRLMSIFLCYYLLHFVIQQWLFSLPFSCHTMNGLLIISFTFLAKVQT